MKYHGIVRDVNYLATDALTPLNPRELAGAEFDMQHSGLSPHDWALAMNFSDPTEVTLFRGGELIIQNGHHRYLAAKILGIPLHVRLTAINVEADALRQFVEAVNDGTWDADDPDIRHNPPMKSDDRAEKIARIKALKEAVRPLVEKGNLTASEAVWYELYMREISTLRYSIARPWTTTEKIPSQEVRKSALPSEIILVARNELLLNPLVYGAITEAAFGVHLNADTAVDRVMGDHDPQVSAQEFYDTFSGTREALRRYFGDTMVLYRAVGLQKKKLTTNWASTDAIARLYGDRIITEMFPVDNVVAVNVSLSGTYEELIVISDPLTTG